MNLAKSWFWCRVWWPMVWLSWLVKSIAMSAHSQGRLPFALPSPQARLNDGYLKQAVYFHSTPIPTTYGSFSPTCQECDPKYVQLQSQLEYVFTQLDRLNDENEDWQDLIRDLASQNKRLIRRIARLESKLHNVSLIVTEMNSKNPGLLQRVTILERAAMALKETRDAHYSHLTRRINRLEDKIGTVSNVGHGNGNVGHANDNGSDDDQLEIIAAKIRALEDGQGNLDNVTALQEDLQQLQSRVTELEENFPPNAELENIKNAVKDVEIKTMAQIDALNMTFTDQISKLEETTAENLPPSVSDQVQELWNQLDSRVTLLENSRQSNEAGGVTGSDIAGLDATLSARIMGFADKLSALTTVTNELATKEENLRGNLSNLSARVSSFVNANTSTPSGPENSVMLDNLNTRIDKVNSSLLMTVRQNAGNSNQLIKEIQNNQNRIEVLKMDQMNLAQALLEVKNSSSPQPDAALVNRIVSLEQSVRKIESQNGAMQDQLLSIFGQIESCCSVPPLPDYPDVQDTPKTDASPRSFEEPVIFCGQNQAFQRVTLQPLVYESVRLQNKTWLEPQSGLFSVPKTGKYLFSVYLNTRTCGSLSLCANTVIQLRNQSGPLREFKTGSSSGRRNDVEHISATTFMELSRGDTISLEIAETIFDGVSNLEFCGHLLA